MAKGSTALRGIRGAALVNGKVLDDVLIGIDPSGLGTIASVARARSGSALASRARRVEGLIIPGYVDVHLHGAGGHDVLGPGGAHELLMWARGVRNAERDIVACGERGRPVRAPALVPIDHPIATTMGSLNAVVVEGKFHVLQNDPYGLYYRMTEAVGVK